jgi:hypothetical protein
MLTSLTVHMTYAVLTSQAGNNGSKIATGTLTLSNTVGTGTACLSQSGTSNVNTSCDVLLGPNPLWYPVSSPATAGQASVTNLTIKATGSLPASKLSLYMPSCTAAPTSGAPVNPSPINPCCPNGSPPCHVAGQSSLDFYVQETDSSFTTPTYCWYPVPATGACSLADDTLGTFFGTYTTALTALPLGSGPAALGSRYFQIGIAEPVDGTNGLQGQAATLTLNWHMDS